MRIISGLCFMLFETFFRNGTWDAAEGAGASLALLEGKTLDILGGRYAPSWEVDERVKVALAEACSPSPALDGGQVR